MKVDRIMFDLVSELEYEIGSSCYNAKSYDGNTGVYGRSFRYPIVYDVTMNGKTVSRKSKYRISTLNDIGVDNIETVCYKFGANELCIGASVIRVLGMLEKRYGLDFNALEYEYINKQLVVRDQEVNK